MFFYTLIDLILVVLCEWKFCNWFKIQIKNRANQYKGKSINAIQPIYREMPLPKHCLSFDIDYLIEKALKC